MKKVLFLNLNAWRRAALMVFFSIIILSFSSCASLIDALLGNSTCIEPGCDRDARAHSSYCIIHSDKEPVKVDTTNPYKLHKPLENTDVKLKNVP
ncbi:MAG TPA: hypothetical protein VFC69_04685 [Dysgonamonadaceae bacterium]|nr:hypothetical protein [Dysgonamonadaceae bacterium]